MSKERREQESENVPRAEGDETIADLPEQHDASGEAEQVKGGLRGFDGIRGESTDTKHPTE